MKVLSLLINGNWPGHWGNECPLLVVAQAQPDGKKLSNHFIDLCDSEPLSGSNDAFQQVSEIDNRPVEKSDFLEREYRADSVRGRLKTHILAWKELEPTEAVLSVIKEGYKLPLYTIPESCILRNNKSAFDNNDFVTEALNDLLATQCISVVESRHVNPHLFKYKLKCEDISTAKDLLGEGYYLYTFDIKSAYHHVEMFQSHRTYLGFQWFYQGNATYFVFNVLPFGLSTTPYIFTKLLKPLIGHWRGSGKRICMFLDDGLGGNSSKQSATVDAKAVKEDLDRLGFVLS